MKKFLSFLDLTSFFACPCSCSRDTQIGCHLDWLPGRRVVVSPTLDVNGLFQLHQTILFYIIHHINCLAKEICGAYPDHILQVQSSHSTEVLDLVKQSILYCGNSLDDLLPLVIDAIKEALVQKSVEDLRQLNEITATYRMTNKPLPVRHSPYVAGLLRPLKSFLDGERASKYLTNDARNNLLLGSATDITSRYYDLAADLVSMAQKRESSLERRARASSDISDRNVSDTDKICVQLFIDIQEQEYGRNLGSGSC